jgi:hypothetical protein
MIQAWSAVTSGNHWSGWAMIAEHLLVHGNVNRSLDLWLSAIAYGETTHWKQKREVEQSSMINALFDSLGRYMSTSADHAYEGPMAVRTSRSASAVSRKFSFTSIDYETSSILSHR